MKNVFIISVLLLTGLATRVSAQCSFTPRITPESMILCPNTQDTLWTQVYDSYQWYKAGSPISGATLQYYVVDHYRDAGSRFSVEVTLDGCTEMSDDMLVDGWAFLGVTVMSSGNYQFDRNRQVNVLCDSTAMQGRDTMILTLNMPYNTNIQWFRNSQPIPGANSNVYHVTETGDYVVEGAPATCPDYIQRLGVTIRAELRTPVRPVITPEDDRLIAGPSGAGLRDFQWYLEGTLIAGATDSVYMPLEPGKYTVSAGDGFCADLSDPYDFIELPGMISGVDARQHIFIYPNPASSYLNIRAPFPVQISITSVDGKVVLQEQPVTAPVDISRLAEGLYVVKFFDWDGMLLKTEKFQKVSADK